MMETMEKFKEEGNMGKAVDCSHLSVRVSLCYSQSSLSLKTQ